MIKIVEIECHINSINNMAANLRKIWINDELYSSDSKYQEDGCTSDLLATFGIPGGYGAMYVYIYEPFATPTRTFIDPKTEHFTIKTIINQISHNGQIYYRAVLASTRAPIEIFRPADIQVLLSKIPGRDVEKIEPIAEPGEKPAENPVKKQVRSKKAPTKQRKPISKVLRRQVWTKRNGRSLDGKCFCCTKAITIDEFECGHIVPDIENGTVELPNLEPICRTCNRSMAARNMHEFMSEFANMTV